MKKVDEESNVDNDFNLEGPASPQNVKTEDAGETPHFSVLVVMKKSSALIYKGDSF